jgi:alpha-tubulin suppressor-like RCC1 family protein/subtilisin family serine protease
MRRRAVLLLTTTVAPRLPVLSRMASVAVVAAGILVAAILLLMTASARAVVPEEHAASAPNNDPPTNDTGAIPGQELRDPAAVRGREFASGEVIVKFKEDVGPGARANVRSQVGLKKEKDLSLIKAEVDKVEGRSVEDTTRALERRPEVQYAEPNLRVHPAGYADEPRFGELWGLNNTGQNGGTSNVDINALEASAITNGDHNLVVAVIDQGVNFSHPDLAGKAWTNPGEVPNNNVDDDNNGYVDDVNGWDFFYGDKSVYDSGEDWHGTHVSGTIAASIDGQGVVGVAPNVKIMALKFLGPNGGWTDDAILAIQYAKAEGAKISNNSWGGGESQALYDAINNSGSLFVAAAGNDGNNNDAYPFYPASYDLPNILSVAAVNNQGKLADFSNYGATSVDIAAPGVGILSTVPGTPENSAAALSSVGSSGKALTAGFGADEIGESAKRTSFFTKAFQAVNRGSQQVVLVDDDADDVGFPDVGPSVSSAIQGATGSAPQEIDVPFRSNGPDLSQLSGKTVVWATGQAYLSDGDYIWECGCVQIWSTTLTSTDQATLTQFLNGGGKLIITGMNALYFIEGSPFVRGTLNLDVASLVGGETFIGASGTAFAGESYTFNSPTANTPYHAKVAPATSAAVSHGRYPFVPGRWESWSGTSMATPHATGAAALVASAEPALLGDPVGFRSRIMNGKPLLAAAGKTVSGDMVDALKALKPPADSTAPTVSSATPDEGATNVATATNVVASFSEAMDAASATDPANFTLRNEACAGTVPATLSYDSANATLDPSAPLDESSTYRVTVSGAWDLSGNQLDQDPNTSGDQPRSWSFTTAAPPPGTSLPTPNVRSWGSNGAGQLGDCTITDRTSPVQVSNLSGVTDVSSGCDHSLALKEDGTVWAWGDNQYGQLGDGTTTDRYTPVKVSGLSGVTDVSSPCTHSLAVKEDGTVWAWGNNGSGKLGDSTTTDRYTPVKVSGLSGVTDVAGGWVHSLAVKEDGTVWAWGRNEAGQLGNGSWDYDAHSTPVQVSGLSGVKDVAGGAVHSLAVKEDGTAWSWGRNDLGQLGIGTKDYNPHPTPVKISGLSGVEGVSGGSFHSLALKEDGTVLTWGSSGYSSSGDGTTPVQVSGLSGVTGVSGGSAHTLALKEDGTVWTWGNTYGSGNIPSPVQLSGLSSVTDVAAGLGASLGGAHNLAVSDDIPPPGDSQPPSPPTITSPQNNTYDTDGSFSVSGSAEAASTVELFEGTTSKGTTTADSSSGAWSIALSGVSDGSHTYTARATDAASSTSPASNSVTVKVDSAPPQTNIASGPSGPTNDTTPAFSFSGSDNLSQAANLSYSYKVDGGAWSAYSSETSVTLGGASGLSEGSHTFYVKAKDEAGQEDQSPAQRSFTVDTTQPMVNSTTPSVTTSVGRGTNLTATFSEKMETSTVNTTTFKLYKVNTDGTQTQITDVAVSLSSADGLTATLNPFGEKTTLLARNTKYKGVITTGTKDLAGNPLAQQKSWTFTTKS